MISLSNPAVGVPGSFKIIDEEPGKFAFGLYKNVLVIAWPDQATGAAVERLGACTREIATRYPQGYSNVHLIASGALLPTQEAREGFVDLMKKRRGIPGCVAIVVAGTGFWASALHSILTGMRVVTPRTFPLRIFSKVEEAAEWLPTEHNERTAVSLSKNDLLPILRDAYPTAPLAGS